MYYERLIDKITIKLVKIMPKKYYGFFSFVKAVLFRGYGKKFYGQDGIDAILKAKIGDKKIFYVDVGANHPFWASNTYSFYRNGSKGINMDSTPGLMKYFKLFRKRDVNLEVAISNQARKLSFYIFETSGFNSFDAKLSKERSKKHKIKEIKELETQKLSEILDIYLPKDQVIDLLSIDTEGYDLEVLKSNNWNKYLPQFIVVEEFGDIDKIRKALVSKFLEKKKYKIVAFTGMNILFERK